MRPNDQLPPTPAESVTSCLNDEFHDLISGADASNNSVLLVRGSCWETLRLLIAPGIFWT